LGAVVPVSFNAALISITPLSSYFLSSLHAVRDKTPTAVMITNESFLRFKFFIVIFSLL
jgi:hypothetical protein